MSWSLSLSLSPCLGPRFRLRVSVLGGGGGIHGRDLNQSGITFRRNRLEAGLPAKREGGGGERDRERPQNILEALRDSPN